MNIRHDQLIANTDVSTLSLYRGISARLRDARGTRVRVESGCVWITHERCRADVVVSAGETYVIDRDGMTIVSSLGRRIALVAVETPAPGEPKPSLAERLGNLCRRLHLQSMPASRC